MSEIRRVLIKYNISSKDKQNLEKKLKKQELMILEKDHQDSLNYIH